MFSKATEYALRATIYIAQKSSTENKLSLDDIATAIGSPRAFTAKIMQVLTKDNKIISSTRGPNGGFYISDKAKEQPLIAILRCMNERDIIDKCVLGLKKCSEKDPCPLHYQYKTIKADLLGLFDSKSIQQLANEIEDGNATVSN